MSLTNVSVAQARGGLVDPSGAKWQGDITYSIPGAGAVWAAGYGAGEPSDAQYSTFNATQAANFRAVMELWDSYIAPSITEVADSTPGDIRVAFTDVTAREGPNIAAYAYGPTTGGTPSPQAGDVWVDESRIADPFAQRTQGFELLLHEVGHSLGLKHPFEAPTLPAGYDLKTYTVMSYTAEDNFFTWTSGGGSIFVNYGPTVDFTPMVLDILAIQDHYGADSTTGAGNTVYAFTDTDLNGRQAIYDAGGIDTIDLSALSRGSVVDLRRGAYSDIAYYNVEDQIEDLSATHGAGFETFIRQQMTDPSRPAYEWERNVGISFSTLIENFIGSPNDESVIGNEAANVLNGGGGRDFLRGLGGNDIYYVDSMTDTVDEQAAGSSGTDTIITSNLSINLGDAVRYRGAVEQVVMQGGAALNATGNGLANVLIGNSGGNFLDGGGNGDLMRGLGGNDRYQIDHINDRVDELFAGSGGTDTVFTSVAHINLSDSTRYMGPIEQVILQGAAALNITGSAIRNTLIGNSAANVIDGKGNADFARGMGGNDIYYVDNVADIVDEAFAGSSGKDTVYSSTISVDLLNATRFMGEIEQVILTGTAALNATGNALDNALVGNDGANVLRGGLGRDTLVGGLGPDRFVFASPGESPAGVARDRVVDFEDSGDNDTIDLSGYAGTLAFIGAAAFFGANQIRAIQSGVDVLVQVNVTDTGVAEGEILLLSTALAQVDATDFIV